MSAVYYLTETQCDEWLHWEQGMDRTIPLLGMIKWMHEQGYDLGRDWICDYTGEHRFGGYMFTFPNEEIKTMFLLKFS